MLIKTYVAAPETLSELNEATHEFYLDLEPEYVLGFSRKSLNAVCHSYPSFSAKFIDVALALRSSYKNDMTEYCRPGIGGLFTDYDWLSDLITWATPFIGNASLLAPAQVSPHFANHVSPNSQVCEAAALGTPNPMAGARDGHEPDLQLFFPEPNVGQMLFPILFARLPLFRNGSNPDTRETYSQKAPLLLTHTLNKRGVTTVMFIGEEMRQGEREVFARLLNEAARAKNSLSEDFTLKLVSVLHSMPGRGQGGHSRKAFRNECKRLTGAMLTLRTTDPVMVEALSRCLPKNESVKNAHVLADKAKAMLVEAQKTGKGMGEAQQALESVFVEISFSMLSMFTESPSTITYRLSREIRGLFGARLSFGYDEATYYSLPRRGYSRQLYVYYNSHYDCWPMTVAELNDRLGSDMESTSNFKREMDCAHEALELYGVILGFEYRQPAMNGDCRSCQHRCYIVRRAHRELLTDAIGCLEQ